MRFKYKLLINTLKWYIENWIIRYFILELGNTTFAVASLIEKIFYDCRDTEYKWFPVPLHSSITIEEQAQPFLPAPQGYRKIILATNIAESSITVPDVMFGVFYT